MSADRDRETRETRLEADFAAWLYDHPSNYDRVSLCDQAADMIAGPLAPALRAVREHDALRRDLAALAGEWERNGGWDLDYAARIRALLKTHEEQR